MRKYLIIFFLFTLNSYLFCQDYIDVIHLENGSVIRGIITEQNPDGDIKIQTADGSIFVYEMSQVIKISKVVIENPIPTREENFKSISEEKNNTIENSFKNNKLWSFNLTGLLIGGVSSITNEAYSNDKKWIDFTRYNLWTYFDNDDYSEYREIGIGFGTGIKKYSSNSNPFSGLSFSITSDAIITYAQDIYEYSYNDDYNEEYMSIAFAISGGIGFAIPIAKMRLEPVISVSFVLIINDEDVLYGFLPTPQLNIGFVL